jgi:hypothetical protein
MAFRLIQLLALLIATLVLGMAGAYLFDVPNEIGVAQDRYFLVQEIYRGWALLGMLWISAIVANLLLVIMSRGQGALFWFAVFAFLCNAGSLAIFCIWTHPESIAAKGWNVAPGTLALNPGMSPKPPAKPIAVRKGVKVEAGWVL